MKIAAEINGVALPPLWRYPNRPCMGCGGAPCGCYVRKLTVDGETLWLDEDHPRYHEAFWEQLRRPMGH